MTEQQEKKNNLIALLSTIGVHSVILLLMFFIIAWRAPNPPLSELGVAMNLGLYEEGSGDIQPEEPIGSEHPKVEESKPEEPKEVVEKKEEAKPQETEPDDQVVSKLESPVVVKEKKKDEVKPIEKPKDEIKSVDKPKEKVEEKPIAVYKPNTTKTDGEKTSDTKEGKPGNQGDDINKKGDKGDPQGTPDAKAMYGKQGGGGGGNGPALDLYGWDWDNIPDPEVPDSETGRIVFLIEVDEDGNLSAYHKESSTVSVATERACIAAIQKLTFSKKSGAKVPPISKGKITFVVRAK